MAIRYKLMPGEECHNCSVDDMPLYKFAADGFTAKTIGSDSYYLCEICASTHFSKALLFPNQISDPTLYQSIAGGLNMILREVRKGSKRK